MRLRKRLRASRLTVVVPLHKAQPWIDVISANISLLPERTQVILSDITGHDDAIDLLARRHNGDRRIRLHQDIGRPGWREHANELLQMSRTRLFAILPQDDTITPGYYEKLVAALDSCPTAGLAFGPIEATFDSDAADHLMDPPPFAPGSLPPWEEAVKLDQQWNLGIPYRGVVRRRLARPIPPTPGDRFADQAWVFSIALVSHLVEVPDALYIKRYHSSNTHTDWLPLSSAERLEAFRPEIERRLKHMPEERDTVLAAMQPPAPSSKRNLRN